MDFDFEKLITKYEEKEIEKDDFVKQVQDRMSFLDAERKTAYQKRDDLKKQLRESNDFDSIKSHFDKEIDGLKESKKQSKIESQLMKKEIVQLAEKLNAYNPDQVLALIDTSDFQYDEKEGFRKPVRDTNGEIVSFVTLAEEVQGFLSSEKNDNLVKSPLIIDGLGIFGFERGVRKTYPRALLDEADEKGLAPDDVLKINELKNKKLAYRR